MKKAWIYICIPPILALLTFLVVRSLLSVPVPTPEEIDKAPWKNPPLGSTPRVRFSAEKLAEALRRVGVGQEDSSGSASESSETEPSPNATQQNVAFKEDLRKQLVAGSVVNHRAHICAVVAAIVVAVVGYGVVGFLFYRKFRFLPAAQDAEVETQQQQQPPPLPPAARPVFAYPSQPATVPVAALTLTPPPEEDDDDSPGEKIEVYEDGSVLVDGIEAENLPESEQPPPVEPGKGN
jgi:hypothetical protein